MIIRSRNHSISIQTMHARSIILPKSIHTPFPKVINRAFCCKLNFRLQRTGGGRISRASPIYSLAQSQQRTQKPKISNSRFVPWPTLVQKSLRRSTTRIDGFVQSITTLYPFSPFYWSKTSALVSILPFVLIKTLVLINTM